MSEGKPFVKCGELFDRLNAFDYNNIDQLFFEAMNETLRWHVSHCNDYRTFLAESGIVDYKQMYQPEQIPPLLVDIFQKYNIVSVPGKQIKFEIYANNKKLILDARSHKRLLKIFNNIFKSLDLVDYKQKVNYLCLTFDSKFDTNKNANRNFFYDLLTSLTAHRSVYFANRFHKKTNSFYFDIEGAAKKLIDFSCHYEPIRIIGKLDELKAILDWFETNNISLKLPLKSFVFILDDFENYDYERDYGNFINIREKIEKILFVYNENIRNIFIPQEQGIPYVTCCKGNFHLPIYSKAMIIDPESLLPLPLKEEGLLTLLTPYLSAYPAVSLLTNYKAIIDSNCSCGIKGDYFKIIKSYSNF